jgi:hypothetical protein
LIKDRDPLLTFYDFPAEHWKHLRTPNIIDRDRASPHVAYNPLSAQVRLPQGAEFLVAR